MRLSLRSRVLAATLVLVVGGLAFAGVATYFFLRSFLLRRLDQQLASSESAAPHVLAEQLQFGASDQGGPASVMPPGTYVAALDASGQRIPGASTTVGYPGPQPVPKPPRGP